jgi:hypothetical protein
LSMVNFQSQSQQSDDSRRPSMTVKWSMTVNTSQWSISKVKVDSQMTVVDHQ